MELQSLKKKKLDNTGGQGQTAYIAKLEDILTLREPAQTESSGSGTLDDLVTITGTHVMKPGKKFHEIYGTLEEGNHDSELQGETDGKSFLNKAAIYHPGAIKEIEGFAQMAKNEDFIILVQDKEKNWRQIGHKLHPARLAESGFTSGKKASDRKGRTFMFASSDKGPAPFYTGSIDSLLEEGSGSGA